MAAEYVSVLLDLAIDRPLDYAVPLELQGKLIRGMRVEVPVRGRKERGYIFDLKERPSFTPVQPLSRLLTDEPLLTSDLFELALWMARYYCTSIYRAVQMMVPSIVRKDGKHKEERYLVRAKPFEELRAACVAMRSRSPVQASILEQLIEVKGPLSCRTFSRHPAAIKALVKKGLIHEEKRAMTRSPLADADYFPTLPKQLNDEQKAALEAIVGGLESGQFAAYLLYGVTGSGKTEVYMQAIERTLALEKGVILLVPEIALTVQTIERFRSRFTEGIAILHHRLSEGERFDEWHRIRRGEAKIVIGARSAIFSPIPNLGLVIVDEEHEASYKQQEMPCYHARDVAVMRAKIVRGCALLGSATPAFESFSNSQQGKYQLLELSTRQGGACLADVSVVDMRKEHEKAGRLTCFSDLLLQKLKQRHQRGEQAILFLNRRGYHAFLLCSSCGKPVKCTHCDLSLTYHKRASELSCHLCGYTLSPPPKRCPSCQSSETMRWRGVGTEHVESTLKAIFPDLRTIRLDADTTRRKGSHQALLRAFKAGKADVLIGTQMVAKGLHFPEVTLVGILNCDSGLNIPDFRAAEQTFQLITQVAGRAGRGVAAGEVLLQTAVPDNRTIQLAAEQDYKAFYAEESAARSLFGYPPTSRLIKVALAGGDPKKTEQLLGELRAALARSLSSSFRLSPIAAAGYPKVRGRWHFQFLIFGPSPIPFSQAFDLARKKVAIPRSFRLVVDVDPTSTFF